MDHSDETAKAISEWIVNRFGQVVDNNTKIGVMLNDAARMAVIQIWDESRNEFITRAQYTQGYNGCETQLSEWPSRALLVSTAGAAVVKAVRDWLDGQPESVTVEALREVLDLSHHESMMALGRHYLPAPEDISDTWWDA